MTIQEAANVLGVTMTHIRRLVVKGRIPAHKRRNPHTRRPELWVDGRVVRRLAYRAKAKNSALAR